MVSVMDSLGKDDIIVDIDDIISIVILSVIYVYNRS